MSFQETGRFVQPEVISTHFHFREGEVIADFGAGSGYFLAALSQLVGPEGRVYACDIQKTLVEKLGIIAQEQRLSNIEPLWCDLEAIGGTKLADGVLDGGVLINTLFQIEDKETVLQELARVIRPGGKLFVVDWTESFAGLGPQPGAVIDALTVQSLAEAQGFAFDRTFPAGDHHYGSAFRRS
ncbi:MAG: methyltransferase domain-containing protein [Candidatus Pacebacteria bacterium]|nr:methyltransferase domain-containing protein [Candidatus Paceibacterota bacterium]